MKNSHPPLLTPQQVKANLHKKGVTLHQWAIDNGYKPNRVYRILNGLDKCKYGIGHEIAIKLGIKANPNDVDHAA